MIETGDTICSYRIRTNPYRDKYILSRSSNQFT
jgi:hypothetical protein